MKLWLVSDGDYSDYSVVGVFDCPEKAEKYRAWFNYDEVEEGFELNPDAPPSPEGDHYELLFFSRRDEYKVHRKSNTDGVDEEWIYSHGTAYCSFFARTLEHANKSASDRLRALKAGETFAFGHEYKKVAIMEDGTPTPRHQLVGYSVTYRFNGSQFQEVSRELIE